MTQDFAGSEKAIKGVTDMRDSGPAIASTYLTLAQKSYEALLKDTQAATQAKLDGAGQEVADGRNAARRGKLAVGASAGLPVMLGVMLSMALARGLISCMRQLGDGMAASASGDLGKPLAGSGHDEPGRLMIDAETVRERLAASIRQVQDAAASVRLASSEIATGNADLSHRTDQQAGRQPAADGSVVGATQRHRAQQCRCGGARDQDADQRQRREVGMAPARRPPQLPGWRRRSGNLLSRAAPVTMA